jgi:hypothetical protein
MSCEDNNLGIAKPRVYLLENHLPNIKKRMADKNLEIASGHFKGLENSAFFSPILVDHIEDERTNWSACFPSRRRYYVNNILASTAATPDKTITWKPIGLGTLKSWEFFRKHVYEFSAKPDPPDKLTVGLRPYVNGLPITAPIATTPQPVKTKTYFGPIWQNTNYNQEAVPNDDVTIDDFKSFLQGDKKKPPKAPPRTFPPRKFPITDPTESEPVAFRGSVLQNEVRDGLWWGIESNSFVRKNMPFGVSIEMPREPPPEYQYPTMFVVSIGHKLDRFDLVLKAGTKAILIDYYGVSGGKSGDANRVELDFEFSTDTTLLDVSFMACGGRLVVYINDTYSVYTRVLKRDTRPKAEPPEAIGGLKVPTAQIEAGSIKVFGTNTKANVYAYLTTFAKQCFMAFPILAKAAATKISYSAIDTKGNPTYRPVAELPNPSSSSRKTFGVDCEKFNDSNGALPILPRPGLQINAESEIDFFSADEFFARESIKANLPDSDFHILSMRPGTRYDWLGGSIPYAMAPFFFKLKGMSRRKFSPKSTSRTDITDDLISLQEKASAPDYFQVKKSASLSLYNKGGKWNHLRDKQVGVEIRWGWNKDAHKTTNKTFTGILTDFNESQSPGEEIANLSFEDYMYVLENVPIINSPIYDGMTATAAIENLAQRAGVTVKPLTSVPKKFRLDGSYFLPSGYSFTSPKMKFSGKDMIHDCIIKIAQRFEAYVRFDQDGILNIEKLPGGLLGTPSSKIIPDSFFYSQADPAKIPPSAAPVFTILDKKETTLSFKSTSNIINILTLDRDTRNPIIHNHIAKKSKVIFEKVLLIDQPAYGGLDEARLHAKELGKRVFFPIRKTSFKTVGGDIYTKVLSYVRVDGVPYRILSMTRDYDANSNSFTSSYEGEWLNGK